MPHAESAHLRVKETCVLKKFDARPDGAEWTDEQIEAGQADGYLAEVITTEDGIVIDHWVRPGAEAS